MCLVILLLDDETPLKCEHSFPRLIKSSKAFTRKAIVIDLLITKLASAIIARLLTYLKVPYVTTVVPAVKVLEDPVLTEYLYAVKPSNTRHGLNALRVAPMR